MLNGCGEGRAPRHTRRAHAALFHRADVHAPNTNNNRTVVCAHAIAKAPRPAEALRLLVPGLPCQLFPVRFCESAARLSGSFPLSRCRAHCSNTASESSRRWQYWFAS